LFPKFVSKIAARYITNFGKRGTSAGDLKFLHSLLEITEA